MTGVQTCALPISQLLGQHRECAALRGAGWGRPHATVNYVFKYPPRVLFEYHMKIMLEMEKRGYRPDAVWKNPRYRGKSVPPYAEAEMPDVAESALPSPLYAEHNAAYLRECLVNLTGKGITLDWPAD